MDILKEWEQRGIRIEDGRIIRDEFVRNPETAMKKWQALRSQCGCDHCDECGNNGCGMIFIDGWEFEDVAEGYVGAVSVKRDGPTCYKKDAERREQAEREEYTQMKADIEDGTHMFKACIRAALDLMRAACSGQAEPIAELCSQFNRETDDGRRMDGYTELLNGVVSAITGVQETAGIDALFDLGEVGSGVALGFDDYSLVSMVVLR